MLKMKNPWEKLVKSSKGLYVLDEDYGMLMAHNKHAIVRDRFVLDLIPEPFTGDARAPIVILNTNPGYSPQDYQTLKDVYFSQMALANIVYQRVAPDYPFFMLSPKIYDTPTYKWWRKIFKPLDEHHINMQTISQNIFCIRYVGYHSSAYNVSRSFSLPSMLYTKYLIECSIKRNALILCQRSHQRFQKLVPSLHKYNNIYYALNPQFPIINEYNYGEGYIKCLKLLNS